MTDDNSIKEDSVLPDSSPIRPVLNNRNLERYHLDESDEDSSDEQIDTTLSKKREAIAKRTQNPMSSPARRFKDQPKLQSRALGEKYTLRSRNYIPFSHRQRNDRRLDRQLERRGGNEEMEKFYQIQQEREYIRRLEREAEQVVSRYPWSESDDDSDTIQEDTEKKQLNNKKLELYLKEIEEIERLEDEELDQLLGDLQL